MTNQEVRQPSGSKPGLFYGYIVVVAAFFAMVALYSTRAVFGVFFKPILADFDWTRAMISGVVSVSMIIQGSLAVVMGGLTDRFGPRVVLTLSSCLVGLGYLLMAQTGSLWQLYLSYGLILGVGMGGVMVPLLSTVARWFVTRRNLMSGIVVTGIGIGGLITPPLADWLIAAYDWRVACAALGGAVLVIGVVAAQALRRNPARMGQSSRPMSKGGEPRTLSAPEGIPFKEAAKTGQFWLSVAIYLCQGYCLFSIMVHIVPHATDLGISATGAATILAAMGGAGIIGNLVLGGVGDRIGNKMVCVIGSILTVASLFWLISITEFWMFILFAIILNFAVGGITTAESPLVATLFGMRSHGMILGMVSFGFTIGGALGPFLTGYIFDGTGSYQLAFVVCAAIGTVGLILAALLRPATGERGRV